MSHIILEAETRLTIGKGASRRLRRLENKIPAIVYGGDKKPEAVHLLHNKIVKALESEAIYSSVLTLKMQDGSETQVVLKDMQRHPWKPIIMHMDLQRVSDKDVLTKQVPLHFINEKTSKGVKAGGIINHTMTQVEIRCQVKDLPEYIEVDMKNVDINDVIHLSDLKLPKGVELDADLTEGSHNLPVVSIHLPRAADSVGEEAAEETPVTEVITGAKADDAKSAE